VVYPQLLELVSRYRPSVVWADGDWEQSAEYWRSRDFLAWLYNESPVRAEVAVNDRWGVGTMGHHGGFLTVSDRYDPGHLLPRKWENCLTV
jgi:alpha-L-fucosidase